MESTLSVWRRFARVCVESGLVEDTGSRVPVLRFTGSRDTIGLVGALRRGGFPDARRVMSDSGGVEISTAGCRFVVLGGNDA